MIASLSMTALSCTLAFLAAGWYLYALACSVLGVIALDVMAKNASRARLLLGAMIAAVAGVLIHRCFWTGSGISTQGAVLIGAPALIAMSFLCFGIFSHESKKE